MTDPVIHFGQAVLTVGGAIGLNALCGRGASGIRTTVLSEVTCKTCLRSNGLEWARRQNATLLAEPRP